MGETIYLIHLPQHQAGDGCGSQIDDDQSSIGTEDCSEEGITYGDSFPPDLCRMDGSHSVSAGNTNTEGKKKH
jgi:hypothetical protein